MDAKQFVDDLIASTKQLSTRGRELAEDKLDIPQHGEQRDAMLDGMGKGALAAGALAILLGTGVGRRVTGSAIKIGGLAAVGAVAYKAYKNWQSGQSGAIDNPGIPVNELSDEQAQARSELLLDAMVSAALADGHVDDSERAQIERQLAGLGIERDLEQFIAARVQQPTGLAELAARAESAEVSAEIYLVSRLIIDPRNASEKRYLDALVTALGIDEHLRAELESEAT